MPFEAKAAMATLIDTEHPLYAPLILTLTLTLTLNLFLTLPYPSLTLIFLSVFVNFSRIRNHNPNWILTIHISRDLH